MCNKRGQEDDDKQCPSSLSLWSLPDEIVLEWLVRVPRRYYEKLSCVSRKLRSLVRSPELYRMRSLLRKDPIYICLCDRNDYSTCDPPYHWYTLRPTKTEGYELVPVPFPARFFMLLAASVAFDSEIYFIGGYPRPSDLWILDTKSGEFRQGPVMREPVNRYLNSVGVADGKMYVVQELRGGEIVEEVFDFESGNWQVEGVPVPDGSISYRQMMSSCVSLEGKVYAMDFGHFTSVYNLRQGRKKEILEMPSGDAKLSCMCVAQSLLFAHFPDHGFMWLDTKCDVWRLVTGDVQTLGSKMDDSTMIEYYGSLAIFWREGDCDSTSLNISERIWCEMIALERVGHGIRGTIQWSGVVATTPYACRFLHCLVASH